MKNWLVNVKQEHPLLDEFKEWLEKEISDTLHFDEKYYGFENGDWNCYNNPPSYFNIITLEQWKERCFPKEWIPKQGELVEVREDDNDDWCDSIFICIYKDRYIAEGDWGLDSWSQCKKKPSKIDSKIDELKKLAEEQGLKITINIE